MGPHDTKTPDDVAARPGATRLSRLRPRIQDDFTQVQIASALLVLRGRLARTRLPLDKQRR